MDNEDSRYPNHQVTAIEIVWQSPWVRAVFYIALTVCLVWLLVKLRHGYAFALQVAIISFFIAYILEPVVRRLSAVRLGRVRLGRGPAVVIVYLFLVMIGIFGSVMIGQVVNQLGEIVRRIPTALQNVGEVLAGFQLWWAGVVENLPGVLSERFGVEQNDDFAVQVQDQVELLLNQALGTLTTLIQDILSGGPTLLVTGATNILSTTAQVILILIAAAYALYDFPRITRSIYRLVPVRWRTLYGEVTSKADRAVGGFMRGQIIITSLLGVMIWIGLSLLGIPLALAISFLAAIFNLVPYLGPIIGAVPAVLLGFTVSPWAAVGAIGVFILANQLEGNVLSPMILSRATNLHPLTVLLSIMAGLGLLGLLGALMAVPTVALVKILIEDYLLTRPAYQETPVEEPIDLSPRRRT